MPKEVGIPGSKIIAVHANHFSFSPSNKWISFIVTPTASMAMDSNMLCVISQDGENFQVLDEIILQVGKPKWAPSQDTIAFIAGHGRIVFGFKNKTLKFKEMTMSQPLTPENYADLDFDWVSDTTLVASRLEEKEWTNDFSEHPLPSLYIIQLVGEHQTKITDPPEGFGDYEPQYAPSIEKLIWVRKSSLIDKERTLWISNRDGSDAKEWLKNVEVISIYNKPKT
ncbi:MAG: hypothetical protein LRY73_01090 [Bacillus sp. (in: Bacteria)]|nr:hypothetical protein [Bacillus sp. (in: firmicutes)]